jgi:hypothetical protein
MTKPMSEDEKVVREAWVDVWTGPSTKLLRLYEGSRQIIKEFEPLGQDGHYRLNYPAAAEFTRQRQREIAKAQRGHTWLVSNCPNNWDREYLLDLIDKHLAELQKGMKA